MSDFKHEYTNSWIGVDFDGTLVTYGGWKGPTEFGEPIPMMIHRVKQWLKEGKNVKILTARVGSQNGKPDDVPHNDIEAARSAIQVWCSKHLGKILEVVCCKDYAMAELWDDRAVQLEFNTGMPIVDRLACCGNCQTYGVGVVVTSQYSGQDYDCFTCANRDSEYYEEPVAGNHVCGCWQMKENPL